MRWGENCVELARSPKIITVRQWGVWGNIFFFRKEKRSGQVEISKGNPTGDEYQRCQGVSGAAGDTSTVWGESWCALTGRAVCRLCDYYTNSHVCLRCAAKTPSRVASKISSWCVIHLVLAAGGANVRVCLNATSGLILRFNISRRLRIIATNCQLCAFTVTSSHN